MHQTNKQTNTLCLGSKEVIWMGLQPVWLVLVQEEMETHTHADHMKTERHHRRAKGEAVEKHTLSIL